MNEEQHLERIIKELKEILSRESKRYEMNEHLTPSMRALLEEEIIPALENELNYEPTDEELGYGSEPPLTMNEMHSAAWKEHQLLHSWNPNNYRLLVIVIAGGWYALVPKSGAARHPLTKQGRSEQIRLSFHERTESLPGSLNHWPVRSREPHKV